ncbi:hypothetical protein K8R43_00785 [archaeon]|nr:hypothetical protein [archaeon]
MDSGGSSKFNPKIIQEKCIKAGVSFWLASEVALGLQEHIKPAMTEEETNDRIIQELRSRNEEAANKFENYHKVYVRTSEGILTSFSKERIVESLIRETTLAKSVCVEIAGEVESDIRRLELRYISAPLIREMVNAKLLERKYLQAKKEYTRLGLPIYDVTRKIKESPVNPEVIHKKFADAITEEYALVSILPQEVSKEHLIGAIHIHDLPYFATRPTSLQNDLRWFLKNGVMTDGTGKFTNVTGPAKHASVAISHALRVLISGETHLSGGQSFDFFNTFIAPYTINKSREDVKQMIQSFLYELNQIYAIRGSLAKSSLNFELETPPFFNKEKAILPKGLTGQDTYVDYERESLRFLTIFLETMAEGDARGTPFKMPRIVIKIRDKNLPPQIETAMNKFLEKNELTFLNLRNKRFGQNLNMIFPNHILPGKDKKWFNTLRTGILQEVSINLPRIALTSKEDTQFFNQLDKALEAAKKTHESKKKIIERRLYKDKTLPFLTQNFGTEEYYSLENAPSIVNVIGLDNAVKEYTGKEINREEGVIFADRLLAYINRKIESFNESEEVFLYSGRLDALKASARFSKMNENRFGVKDVYPLNGFSHNHQDSKKWIETEIKLQQYCNGAAKLFLKDWEILPNTINDLLKKESTLSFTLGTKSGP